MKLLLLLAAVNAVISIFVNETIKGVDCTKRLEGSYVIGCSQSYVACIGKMGYEFKCPNNLYYNSYLAKCDEKINIKHCSNMDKDKRKVLKSRCAGLRDGYYSNGCSNDYYHCFRGQILWLSCSANNRFDIHTKICKDATEVNDCSN